MSSAADFHRDAALEAKEVRRAAGDLAPFPHCNSEVLHAHGECVYCDAYPERQDARLAGKTPFSPVESNGWRGNVAWTEEMIEEDRLYWLDLSRTFADKPPQEPYHGGYAEETATGCGQPLTRWQRFNNAWKAWRVTHGD